MATKRTPSVISKRTTKRKPSVATQRTTKHSASTVTLRQLNRATLQRQMLLERFDGPALDAIRRLVGLQAQLAAPPFVGLWSRVANFRREDLVKLFETHEAVRGTLVRGTLHVIEAGDYAQFRPVMQPMLSHAIATVLRERAKGLDPAAIAVEARRFLARGPQTFTAVRDHLVGLHPKLDERGMGFAVRMELPLVQVPEGGAWGFSNDPRFALADAWTDRSFAPNTDPSTLVRRYLAAFGPASARDAQTWSGLKGLDAVFDALRGELRVLHAEDGRELFDLPDAVLPDADSPAPPRFLPDYDNLVLGHADRTRIVPPAFKPRIYLSALRVRATVLVDGFVRAVWKVDRSGKKATLVIEQLAPIAKPDREAIIAEGERLLAFTDAGATQRDVRIVNA